MLDKVFVVYEMGSYLDGNFPLFKGVYTEEPELKSGEYCDEVELINN